MTPITVYKQNALGAKVLSYSGELLAHGETWLHLRAVFQVERATITPDIVFVRGDVFDEWFYTDRWYNVFRVTDGVTGALKGWYCNVTRPAIWDEDSVRSDDLALDVAISAAGQINVLDEDEFAALALSSDEQANARAAVDEIRRAFVTKSPPFG
jgi:predicted RNA-binding protein associated with RNAse of E/G family